MTTARQEAEQELAYAVGKDRAAALVAAAITEAQTAPINEQQAEPDTLPAWLYQRYGKAGSGVDWDELYETDTSYWEHEAAAVRRAVTRGGFKTDAEHQPSTAPTPEPLPQYLRYLFGRALHVQWGDLPTEDRLYWERQADAVRRGVQPAPALPDAEHPAPATPGPLITGAPEEIVTEIVGPTRSVLNEIYAERAAQDAKWGEQNHPDIDTRDIGIVTHHYADGKADIWRQVNAERSTPSTSGRCMTCPGSANGPHTHTAWDGVLLEEVWEALAESDPATLRAELVQVAAVAVCWIEAIDRRNTPAGGERA